MRMKRLISITLALMLVLSIGTTSAYANGWGNGKVPPGLAKKIFNDTDAFKWAEKYIEKLFQKGLMIGVGNDRFAPKESTTKIEAIIMSLRVMGWEDDAKKITKLPKQYRGDKVASWATGYVTLAYEKGILDDVDMMYFKPNDPVKRHEIAKYVIRALGYEKEAQRNMNKKLSFKDASLVPQGSVGYVYLVNDFELMQGDDQNRFNPMGNMTRAETAVLFSRVDDKVDIGKDGVVSGEVTRVYRDRISVKTKDKTETYDLDSRVRVYEDNKRIDIDDIKVGSKVKMEIIDGKVVFIEVVDTIEDDKIITRYTGVVKEIEKTKPYKLAIQVKTMLALFEVVEDVEVSFRDEEGSFKDIQKEDEVTVTVDRRNRIIKIEVDKKYVKPIRTVKGYITDIELGRRYNEISIDKKTYDLDADADVKIDGRSKKLSDLKVGMYVEAELEDDVVIYVDADNYERNIEGEITDITKSTQGTSLKIKEDKTNREYTYLVDKDARIYIENLRNARIEDLRKGDKGEFEIYNNTIIEVYIEEAVEVEEVDGLITDLELTRRYNKISIDKKSYDISSNVKVSVDGRNKTLNDLKIGMYAELVIEKDVVVSVAAENIEKTIEGEIVDIIKDRQGTSLKIEDEDTERVYTFPVDKDAKVEIEDLRNAKIDDLLKGDEGEFKLLNGVIIEIEIED